MPRRITPNFLNKLVMCVIHIFFLKYLFTDSYKATHSHGDYNRRYSIIGLYYSCKFNFFHFEFEKANQPGFEPGSSGYKAASLTIELHSIDKFMIVIIVQLLSWRTLLEKFQIKSSFSGSNLLPFVPLNICKTFSKSSLSLKLAPKAFFS